MERNPKEGLGNHQKRNEKQFSHLWLRKHQHGQALEVVCDVISVGVNILELVGSVPTTIGKVILQIDVEPHQIKEPQ